jgi:hypothetical protein
MIVIAIVSLSPGDQGQGGGFDPTHKNQRHVQLLKKTASGLLVALAPPLRT